MLRSYSTVSFLYLHHKRIKCIVCLILGSILKHQEDTFATELHKLKQQPLFSLVDFENLIDRIRSTVAEVSLHASFSKLNTSITFTVGYSETN